MDDRFYLISLGCPKNRVDSEVVYGTLEMHGWRGTNSPETARVLLVNTCGFIQPAVEESIEEILQLLPYKDADPSVKLVVIGCLVQRYRKKTRAGIARGRPLCRHRSCSGHSSPARWFEK